eukprot:5181076-Pyramimonas_sp.AAC.1
MFSETPDWGAARFVAPDAIGNPAMRTSCNPGPNALVIERYPMASRRITGGNRDQRRLFETFE